MLAPTPQRCYFQTCILSLQQARLSRTTTVDQALGSRTVAIYQSQSTGKFIDGLRMYATRQKTFRCCKAVQLDGSYKHVCRSKAKLLVSNAARNDVADTHKIAQQILDQIERKLHRMLRHSEGLGAPWGRVLCFRDLTLCCRRVSRSNCAPRDLNNFQARLPVLFASLWCKSIGRNAQNGLHRAAAPDSSGQGDGGLHQ